jgi:hypothetical protein
LGGERLGLEVRDTESINPLLTFASKGHDEGIREECHLALPDAFDYTWNEALHEGPPSEKDPMADLP